MATTRVYILAKELGVKSTAIVKKCQDEGLDVKNHMSTISAGLAATIREWFSEGENITTVETTEKVDLKKVRIRKKKTQKRKPPAKKTKKAVKKTKKAKPTAETTAVIEEEPKPEEEQVPTEEKITPEEPIIEEPQEKEPEPIIPAGPILEKPEPARLSGPQVVRVEAPEPSKRPPKPKPKVRYDMPVTEPLMYDEQMQEQTTLAPSKDRKGLPKHPKERTHGRRQEERYTETIKKPKLTRKWRQRDIEERQARLDAARGEGLRLRPIRKIATRSDREVAAAARPKKAIISEPITVKDLSAALAIKSADIISKLMQQDVMATANQTISSDIAELVALELGTELVVERKSRLQDKIRVEFEQRKKKALKKRSVVATMLGHVDHGKTSLLDKIRSTQTAAGEAGGITQHIGASEVTWDDKKVTFLDTPGHEAFTAMRARGANMTDVVVLVVAVDDGVMPQTIEAIHHAKAANVPVIVALNKIDLPGCDINRVYSQLAEQELAPAEWGGKTEVVKTSAITGEGIDDLLEHLDYIAELLELKADDTIPATGWVVEAKMSARQGPVATLLVQEGQLKKGDIVLAGGAFGRVKTLRNSYGKTTKIATSSMPVEITGLNDVPQAGDRFYRLDDINKAKAAAEENQILARENTLTKRTQVTLDNLFSEIEAGNVKELNIIIRADVQGSVDVLTKYLSELSTEEVKIKILHAAPGGITEGDVVLAEASNAIIIGFNVVSEEHVAKTAEAKGVEIRLYNVIYRITEDLQKSMEGMLEPEETEKSLGRAAVRAVFKVSKVGTVAGCYVSSGIVNKNAKVRLIRDNIVIRDDLNIETLKHFKDDVREVKAGLECGIKIAGFDDIKVDDVFDFYEIVKIARTL
ncbi:MAG: translation initiation factor IF-2 [Phycisphaerae bacterium]|nr:translation initiation factor IF-2 [Phycisphaerae bacterium]NIP54079.1 translation initiation factor IF-2 [Phycisphaerae bacterium]NIS53007.1 translation initiation factor IF-2 [Phycisphaerae bacterium]NIU10489.1 translation initiation factor IF-2 [Phycisphaerae bacterium]NIU58277.1 translation initiation factor IF-2 [Phycisphaerae bacterium]